MPKLRTNFLPLLPIFILTIVIYALTKLPVVSIFKLQLLLIVLIALPLYGFYLKSKGQALSSSHLFIYLTVTFILCLVGATGWFFSPFFFTLYLMAIMLSFIYSIPVAVGFVLTLVGLFSFNIGDVDLAYDYLVVLSLLTTIPLSMYLRKEYIRLKETEKEILVLEQEKKDYQSKVEEVLANIVNNFAVNLRQPINDIKQLGYYLEHQKSQKGAEKYRSRIISSSEEAIKMLNEFEEKATGKKLLSTPNPSPETS